MRKLLIALSVTTASATIALASPPPFCMFSPRPPPTPTYPHTNDMAFWYQYEASNQIDAFAFALDSSPEFINAHQPVTTRQPKWASGDVCYFGEDKWWETRVPAVTITAITFSAWFKAESVPHDYAGIISGRKADNTLFSSLFIRRVSETSYYPRAAMSAAVSAGVNGPTITDSEWHHFVAAWSTSQGHWKMLVDGALYTGTDTNAASMAWDHYFRIGNDVLSLYDDGSRSVRGWMDEVVMLTNRCLTTTEMTTWYGLGRGVFAPDFHSLPSWTTYPVTENMAFWYQYEDESAVNGGFWSDSSPAGNTATQATASARAQYSAGSAYFDGGDWSAPASTTLLKNRTAFTMSAWVKEDTTANYSGVIMMRDGNDVVGVYRRFAEEYVGIRADTDDIFSGIGTRAANAYWNHVIVSWQQNGAVKLRLNGQPFHGTATSAAALGTCNDLLRVGWDDSSADRKYKGYMDEVCVWTNAALSDVEQVGVFLLGRGVTP